MGDTAGMQRFDFRRTIRAASRMAVTLVEIALPGRFEGAIAANKRGDHAMALRLLRPLANGDHCAAQNALGMMYGQGKGVPQDYAEALKWYRRAADRGNAGAQDNLGIMYASGNGVPQDYVEAHKWFTIAALRLPESTARDRDRAAQHGEWLAQKMTLAQIAEAQKRAREWKPAKQRC
jgi:TPR repeat protein